MRWLLERMENLRWTRFLVLRGLGVTFGVAFASLAVQIRGLVGENGILPAAEYLSEVRRVAGVSMLQLPTVFWWGCSDAWLTGVCWLGVFLSLLMVLGVAQRWVLILLWASYLSLTTVGGVFLHFQWDSLLLETAVTALPLTPAALWPGATIPAPSRASVLLMRLLLIKLMLLSGVVKLGSGNWSWRQLTALEFHFWTQPLPSLPGWWLAHAPGWLLQAMCGATLFIELLLPLGILGPRRLRLFSCAGLVLLQLMIGITGNYGFFGLLTLVLCASLLDDEALGRHVPRVGLARQERASPWTLVPIGLLATLSGLTALEVFLPLPDRVADLLSRLAPLESVNRYGLFASMTRQREEIRIQGSEAGQEWRDYVFRYKPGSPGRAPPYMQPHLPRLDWQMWFAALGTLHRNRWLLSLEQRLLENRPEVTSLLASNPFPGAPPRYLRATIAPYRTATLEEHRSTGDFWREGPVRPYSPVVTLDQGKLIAAPSR